MEKNFLENKKITIDLPHLCNDIVEKVKEIVSIVMEIENINAEFSGVLIKENSYKKRLLFAHIIKQVPKPYTDEEYSEAASYGGPDLYELQNSTISRDILIEMKFDYLHTDSEQLKILLLKVKNKKEKETILKEKEKRIKNIEFARKMKMERKKQYIKLKQEFEE